MRKINILIDSMDNSGGTDRVASVLANSLIEHNILVDIFVLRGGDAYYPLSKKVKYRKLKGSNRIIKIIRFCKAIKNGDKVLVISMGKLSAQAIPIIKTLKKCDVICSDHVSFESFPKYIRILKLFAYRLANKVVVLTNNDKEVLNKYLDRSKIEIIKNSSPFKKEVDCAKENIILAVGRLTYQKNFKELLEIWKRVNNTSYRLLIVGDGEDKPELLKYIKKNNLNNVNIIPPSKNIQDYYSVCKILVLTSRYEGLPMVMIEAKNFGLATIAYDCKTGPAELIENDGILIEYGNRDKFVESLNKLMMDNAYLEKLSQKAYMNSECFDEKYIADKWVSLIWG